MRAGTIKMGRQCSFLQQSTINRKSTLVLLKRRPGINDPNTHGATPLIVATMLNRFTAAHLLLEQGFNTNLVTTKNRDSPLQSAIKTNGLKPIDLFLDHGANSERVAKFNTGGLANSFDWRQCNNHVSTSGSSCANLFRLFGFPSYHPFRGHCWCEQQYNPWKGKEEELDE